MTPGELLKCDINDVLAVAAMAMELTFTYQSRSNIAAYLGKHSSLFNYNVALLTPAQRQAAKATAEEAKRLLTYLTEIS